MTKERIPQSIIDKINKEYPLANKGSFISDFQNIAQVERREAAIWGYGLSEGRIKELEELYKAANIQHKYLCEVYIEATDKLEISEQKIKELEEKVIKLENTINIIESIVPDDDEEPF